MFNARRSCTGLSSVVPAFGTVKYGAVIIGAVLVFVNTPAFSILANSSIITGSDGVFLPLIIDREETFSFTPLLSHSTTVCVAPSSSHAFQCLDILPTQEF
ncbi:hypothetical protein ADUPG1_009932 [Aduncisulcus paluster]|uniref:Uncharacterized protein n=1 Tax=Aduncisulcus paluster TaxID=2918883 RepID=A0ABQ5KXB2_9EUKA|nr:hypothetical protein ADUPG1_009932 [Aduncisulcus paluster]